MRIFSRSLPRTQYAYALFLAGRQNGQRDHWLELARGTVENRSLYVAYAKSAHRAYLNALKLVRELHEQMQRRAHLRVVA